MSTRNPGSDPHGTTAGDVEVRREGDVAVITLARQRKLNALSTHMEARLDAALAATEVRTAATVVITGGERVFSAGADVHELPSMTPAAIAQYYRATGGVYERFADLPQPTVAAIAGYCLGGGLELALAADLRIADVTAEFGLPEVGIGIVPSSGGLYRLTHTVGPAHTRDLVLRGRRVDTEEAFRLGLVTEITDKGAALPRSVDVAAELATQPPLAAQVAKQAISATADTHREAALLVERLAYTALNRTTQEETDRPRPSR